MVNRRTDQKRTADRKRRRNKKWRKLYATPAWRIRRSEQLHRVPWCEPCKREGKTRIATTVNHINAHHGDPELFFHGPLESVCKQCHDQMIQRAERRGFRPTIDPDGWPNDPAHPFNKAAKVHGRRR